MSVPNRVSLNENDFVKLVSGNIVDSDGSSSEVQIALQDIGFDRMLLALRKSMLDNVGEEGMLDLVNKIMLSS